MMRSLKGVVAGALALASVAALTVEAHAMPVQPITSTATSTSDIEHIWWRGGYGWGWRRPWGYYGWRRPYLGYYGWRRPYLGYYGWRRPDLGYYGWRRW